MESSEPAVKAQHKETEEGKAVERTTSLKVVYNYSEKTILVTLSAGILEEIKKKVHELFGLSCIRLEIDRKPIISADQIFASPSPKITVTGIKNKCCLQNCTNRVKLTSELECKFCSKSFCIKHALPEGHFCDNISECKAQAAEENLKKLLGGRADKS